MNTPGSTRIHTFKRHSAHGNSTGKKAVVSNISKWKRTYLNAVSADEKFNIESKVKNAMNAQVQIGKDIAVGFNSVMRLIQCGEAAVVCVAQDGHQGMLKGLVESTQAKSIQVITIPKLNQSMRTIFGLRSASCFALKRSSSIEPVSQSVETDDKVDQESSHNDHTKSAVVDDLREYLLSLQ